MPSSAPTAISGSGAASQRPPAAGERLGRYVLLGIVGSGGMSDVHLAYDPELDRKVALKLMRVRVGRQRLQREAQALAKLSHPNVVPVHDVGVVAGRAFVAMEYVEGQTLRDWLKEPHPWREALQVLMDAGSGLAAAHARGVIHRDFKPTNVLIGADGRVRVLDFGLARLGMGSGEPTPSTAADTTEGVSAVTVDAAGTATPGSSDSADTSLTPVGQILGTPAYMSPEQWRGGETDQRADVFAFGITAYEALFKGRPFERDESATTKDAVFDGRDLSSPKPPPRDTEVPRHIQRAVLKALAFEPSDRWQSIDEMLAELRRDPYRWVRRAIASAVAVGALGLAAGGSAAFVAARTPAVDRTMCTGGRARVEAVWGPPKRDAVREAFAKTGLPYAGDAAASVTRMLDAYAARIATESDEACAATRLQGSQSEEVMDLRIACYGGRLREVGAFVDILAHADPETVQQATKGATALSTLDDCSDVAALRATAPRPRDPATIARIDTLEQRLAVAKATRDLGKSAEAAKMAEELLPDAKDVRFVPLVARVDLSRGRAYGDLHLTGKAIPALREAFAAALESNEERVLKDSAMSLALQYILLRDQDSFDWWAAAAQASIQRGGPDADADAQRVLDFTRCRAFYIGGRPLARLACLEEYRARVEPLRPLDSTELSMLGVAAVDAGAFAHAVDYASRAADESLRQNGPHHPRSLLLRMHRCRAAISYGDSAAAIADCRGTLETLQGFTAKDAPYLVRSAEILLARALIDGNKLDEGRAILERLAAPEEASSVFAASGDEQDLEDARAELDLKTGHVARALRHFRSALAVALKVAPSGSSVDPDVVLTKLALGKALLAHRDFREARAVLDDALAASARAEIAPTVRTELGFADARALWEVDRPSRRRAWALAKQARDAFDQQAPKTSVYDEMRAGMNEWLAHHEDRAP
jgi:predicted Ser/Thr protein kinase